MPEQCDQYDPRAWASVGRPRSVQAALKRRACTLGVAGAAGCRVCGLWDF